MANPLDPPDGLDADSRAVWLDTLQHILEAGTLQRLDVHSLAAYVQAVRNHQRASAYITSSDVLLERDGKAHINPALTAQTQAAHVIAQFARQFRLTAAAPGQPAAPPDEPVRAAQPMREADGIERDADGTWYCAEHHTRHGTCRRKNGGVCHGQVKEGLTTCRMHPGAGAAAKHLAARLVRRDPTYGEPVKISPERALLEELWRTAGHVRWLAERVSELEAEALTWGTASRVQRWWGEFPGSEEVAKAGRHVLLDLYDRERKHLVFVSTSIIGAGLAARLVDAAQEQGTAYAKVVDAILHDLELSEAQWRRVPQVVPKRFRELMPA